jgi:hypothetical protein
VSVVDDVVPWLREQIAEDRRLAEEACDGPWRVDDAGYAEAIYSADGTCVIGGGRWGGEAPVFDSTEDALHIVRHDPAAVLAQCDAHEALLERYGNAAARRAMLTEAFTRDLRKIAELEPAEERRRCSEVNTANGLVSGYGMAVLLAALAFQHRPGYLKEWRP